MFETDAGAGGVQATGSSERTISGMKTVGMTRYFRNLMQHTSGTAESQCHVAVLSFSSSHAIIGVSANKRYQWELRSLADYATFSIVLYWDHPCFDHKIFGQR